MILAAHPVQRVAMNPGLREYLFFLDDICAVGGSDGSLVGSTYRVQRRACGDSGELNRRIACLLYHAEGYQGNRQVV